MLSTQIQMCAKFDFTYQKLFSIDHVSIVSAKVHKGSAKSESLVHLHQKIDQLGDIGILVDLKTEILSDLLKAFFASLKNKNVSQV